MMDKYNFIIFGLDFFVYETAYNDIIGLKNVQYINNYVPNKNKLINILFRVHTSSKINKLIRLPFKSYWFRYYFKDSFRLDNPKCFIFFGRQLVLEECGYVNYLKRRYPNSKYVCFFQDLISNHSNVNIPHLKDVFDLVISYDHSDSKRYNIAYHPTVYSKIKVNIDNNIKKCDVYFLGAAKNRLDKILRVYNKLSSLGLICEFYIIAQNDSVSNDNDGIHYIKFMTYYENLKHLINSRCILELMQDGATGHTMRTWEAIVYDKLLITDNPMIKLLSFFNEEKIYYLEEVESITSSNTFFTSFDRQVEYSNKELLSPINFLEYLTKELR